MGMTVMWGLPLAFASQPKRWQWPQYWHAPKREPSGLVYARRVRAGTRERMVAVALRGRPEHLVREERREWRQRIIARARRFEGVAARLYLPANVAGLARDRRDIFELVVVRLEL